MFYQLLHVQFLGFCYMPMHILGATVNFGIQEYTTWSNEHAVFFRNALKKIKLGPNISKWFEKLHFNPVSILPDRTVLKNTHLFQVGRSGSVHIKVHVSMQFKHYFRHIMKGKLGSDVRQPGILTGDMLSTCNMFMIIILSKRCFFL